MRDGISTAALIIRPFLATAILVLVATTIFAAKTDSVVLRNGEGTVYIWIPRPELGSAF